MLEIKIRGETVHQLFDNAVGMLTLLVTGGQTLAGPSRPVEPLPVTIPATPSTSPPSPHDEKLVTDTMPPPNVEYTLDDHIKPKIRELMKWREAHLKATLPKEQHRDIMANITDWMLTELFNPLGIKKASDLKPEQMAEFMSRANALDVTGGAKQ